MKTKKSYRLKSKRQSTTNSERTARKKLNADAMFKIIREDFQKIPDQRAANSQISLDDALMSGFAVFQLKHPSLLAFDNFCNEKPENFILSLALQTYHVTAKCEPYLTPLNYHI